MKITPIIHFLDTVLHVKDKLYARQKSGAVLYLFLIINRSQVQSQTNDDQIL